MARLTSLFRLNLALLFSFPFPCRPLQAATSAGQYGSDISGEEQSSDEPQYHGAKEVGEQENRQKDLGKWIKDVELYNINKAGPGPRKPSEPKETPRAPGYLNNQQGLPGQPGFLQNQTEMQGAIDDETQMEKQADEAIEQEIKAARKTAKAGNSITRRADGAAFMFYHGLLMGAKNQHYRNGLGLDTVVNTFNIGYDFSTRLMNAFTNVSTDPRGNVSIQQRLNTSYTGDSSGLPYHLQRVTGYTERDTDINGNVTRVTRSNGQYNSNGNPGFNNYLYGGGMITSYDQTSYPDGYPAFTTTTHFRGATYDAYGNPLTYAQTVINPAGETDVTQRLNSSYELNPHYVDQFTQHRIAINYSIPQFLLTGDDQYMADYVTDNYGKTTEVNFPVEIQHTTDITYNDESLMTGWFRWNTETDNRTSLEITGYSVKSFDQWGNPLTWRTIDTNIYGVLSVADEVETVYDQTNHPVLTVQQATSEDGTVSTTITATTYDQYGLPLTREIQTDSIDYIGNFEIQNQVISEAGPTYPHGGPPLPIFAGGF